MIIIMIMIAQLQLISSYLTSRLTKSSSLPGLCSVFSPPDGSPRARRLLNHRLASTSSGPGFSEKMDCHQKKSSQAKIIRLNA